MLFRKTVVVYCESHTKHTNTLCAQNTKCLMPKMMTHIVPTVKRGKAIPVTGREGIRHVHTQRHRSYGKMSYDLLNHRTGLHHPLSLRQSDGCRTVDVACRHVWKLRLHFIFYYLMRHESCGRRTTDVAVCECAHRVVRRRGSHIF
jgi:hypothetical protein